MVENVSLKNKTTGVTIVIGKLLTVEYALENVDWGTIQGTHYSNKYVGQIGETVLGTALGTRNIEVTGWVLSNDGNKEIMNQRKSVLNSFVSPSQEIQLGCNGYILTFKPDRTIKYSTSDSDNHEYFCKFSITGVCYDPLFKDEVNTILSANKIIGNFKFPLIIPTAGFIFGRRATSQFFDVIYKGVVDTGMIIKLKAANGIVVNPRIIHRDTQKQILINKSLALNEEIIINTNKGERKITGILNGATSNYFKYGDSLNEWLQLTNGDNIFKLDATTNVTALEVSVTYSNKYLEVQ